MHLLECTSFLGEVRPCLGNLVTNTDRLVIHFLTVQVDFNLPNRFDITYVDSNSEKRRPIMIHRAVLGSLERFFGVLIEHYAGDFPLWLSPLQARVLPVTDTQVYTCLIWLLCVGSQGL